MGEVYRAVDTRLRREVAIKVLPPTFSADPERIARFEREAQLLASLNHPSIAQVYGFESVRLTDGSAAHFLSMELIRGEDLDARFQRGPVPLDETLSIALQIAEALEDAHERGIVHRDLKPGNIKVTPEGRVKILDFGLAKSSVTEAAAHLSGSSPHSLTMAHTEAGFILGTAAYMSPEQARGNPVDRRTDVWAFGVVLFEMLTSRRLFKGDTTTDVLAAVMKEPVPFERLPAATPPSIRRLLTRCLERDPKRRLRDIGEARIVLEAPASDRADERRYVPAGSRLLWAAPWVLAAAAMALAVWALSWRVDDAPPDVVHLDIVFPENVEPVAGRQGGIAISPDGKAIAMVGFKNGQRRLYVRRLDTPDATDISGTSGGGVFSPDGASIAFISNSTVLTRVSLADGQQTALASGGDFVTGVSIGWGTRDVFFIRSGSIWTVPANGGKVRQLTTLDPTQGEVLHADPLPLPRDRFVLFSRITSSPGGARIEAIPHEGGQRFVVVDGASTPVWSPTGHLLFGRDGALWAVPLDPATATTTGPAVQVIPAGTIGTIRTGSLGFQVSTTGTLAYVPANFDSKRLVIVGRDGSELPLGLPPGSYGNPRVAPDGRRIAFERDGSVVEAVDLARGTRAVVMPAAVGTNFPVWTADGANLVSRRFNVPFWAAADGTGRAGPIPHGDANTSPGSAGPDGDTIIAVRLLPETAGDLYLLSVRGAFPPKALVATPSYEGSPHLSRDGRWLAYQSNASGTPEVYVRRYPSLDRAWQVSEGGGVQVRWSRASNEIFYRANQQIVAVAFDGSGDEPVLGKPTTLFADVYDFGQGLTIPNYDLTSDGRFLMLRRGTQGGTLRVILNWTEELKGAINRGAVR